MKKLLIVVGVLLTATLNSCVTYVVFTTSEKDAEIYIDGKMMGVGTTDVVTFKEKQCKQISVEKTGFFKQTFSYCYQKWNSRDNPIVKSIELIRDDAYDASIVNDYANKDFEQEVSKSLSEEEAWKIISQIVTTYFDNIEMSDKSTGYMKTSWQTKSFSHITVRTRVIVKQSSSDPLKYKIKIISEYADTPNQSVKDDDKFKEWDRILKKYSDLISEFQFRLGGN